MTRPAPARRRLVPPTLRDEPRDSACALFRSRRTRDRSDISHSSYERRQRRPDAPWPPGRRQFEVADDLWLFRSVAVAKAARATRRSSPPPELATTPPHMSPTRRERPRRHPRLAPAGRVRTRAQHQGRGREAPALAPRRAVGCVSGGVAGRVGWRRRSGGTCRPASVALLRAGRVQPPSWPRMGPLGSLAPLRRGCGLLARDHGRVHIWRVRGVVAGGGALDDSQVRAVRSSVPCWPPTCSRRGR